MIRIKCTWKRPFLGVLFPLFFLFALAVPASAITQWYSELVISNKNYLHDFVYDSAGNPGIAVYYYDSAQVKYVYKNETGWHTELVGSGNGYQCDAVLSYNPAGKACVLYLAPEGLIYAVRNAENSWQYSTVETQVNWYEINDGCSLAFNSLGQPCVSYVKNYCLYYASFNGTAWQKQAVRSVGDVYKPYLAFNGANPAISYCDGNKYASDGKYGLCYAYLSGGTWTVEAVDTLISGTYRNRMISITTDFFAGSPYISYYDQELRDLKFACKTGSSWTVETLDSAGDVGGDANIEISDTDQKIYITYCNFVNGGITSILQKSKSITDESFTTQTVYSRSFGNASPILKTALRSGRYPDIAYYDYRIGQLYLISMQPDIALSASSVSFGNVAAGSENSRDITVTNNGSVFLSFDKIDLPGSPFGITGSLGTGLASGESKTISVSFSPPGIDTNYQDSLCIHSNDPDENPLTIPLTGRTFSNNAELGSVSVNAACTLSYTADTLTYSGTVAHAVLSVRVTPTAAESHASVKVNGTAVASGAMSGEIPLSVGQNSITISVTSEDAGTQKTYYLNINRKDSPDAGLSGLSVNGCSLSPSFSTSVTSYSVTIDTSDSVVITPVASESRSAITINGASVLSGTPSVSLPVGVGATSFTIRVLAPDLETTKNYTITVFRLPDLNGLSLSRGTLSTTFDGDLLAYTAEVPNGVTAVNVTPQAPAGCQIRVQDNAVASGTASSDISLSEGANLITVEVTSQDSLAAKTYSLTVTRLGGLASLYLNDETVLLQPDTYQYEIPVHNVSAARLTPSAPSGMAITINGAAAASGVAAPGIPLTEGNNTVTIEIASSAGTTTYNFTVKRMPLLNSIMIAGTNISLSPDEFNYVVTVPHSAETVAVVPAANSGVAVDLHANLPVTAGPGLWTVSPNLEDSPFYIRLFSEDGQAMTEYGFIIRRIPALSSLSPNAGTLSPAFDSDITQYKLFVKNSTQSIRFSPSAIDPKSTIRVSGIETLSGAESESILLSVGKNTASITVTSLDGSIVNTYLIDIYRASSSDDSTGSYSAVVTGNRPDSTLPVSVDSSSGNATVQMDSVHFGEPGTESSPDVINVPPVAGANSYTLELPAASLTAGSGSGALTLSTQIGTITISDAMLSGLDGFEDKKAGIRMGIADTAGLPEDIKEKIGSRPVIQLALTLDGEVSKWQNPGAPVTVSIPYVPSDAERADPEHIVVWYIDGGGNAVSIPSGRYDPETGNVTFTTTHFSYYAVSFVQKTFNDLSDAEWARNAVEVLASKGIMNGTGDHSCSPSAYITRADYLTLLIRTLGLTTDFTGNFDDVSRSDYFYEAAGIAKELGITAGKGNNKFGPRDLISRQDIFVLTMRALEISEGLEVSAENLSLSDRFLDSGDVSEYAASSVSALIKEGLVSGSGDKLNPLSAATRAEAAVLLYRLYCR